MFYSLQCCYIFYLSYGFYHILIFMFEDVGIKLSSLHAAVEIVTKSVLTVMH